MEWIKNHKNILFNIFLFIILYLTSFIISFMIAHIWCDQIWTYGFSYNISKGLVIYKDFNVIQMPLYFMIASMFIKIFGNHMIATCIFDSLLVAIMGLLMIKSIGWKGMFPFLVCLVLCPSPYNLLCMVFLFIIIYLINNGKYNDYLVAILVGLVFITKQNIGVLLFIPMFLYSKHKIKSTIIFLIPFLLLCIYLLFNNALFEFFDYVFLGMFEFGGNKDIDLSLLVIEILCVGYLLYSFIKSKGTDKEAFYILIFQLVLYPLCELRHYAPVFVPFLYYFLKTCKIKKLVILVCCLVVVYLSSAFYFSFIPINIHTKNDLLFLKSPSSLSNYLQRINKKFDGDVNNIYFDSEYSYLYKLYYNVSPTKLDFLINGNLGHFQKEKSFKELEKHCSKEKCIFLLFKKELAYSQFLDYRNYIKTNYKQIGEYDNMDIYSSK